MYSIKPGRGPSLGSAIGGIVAAVFGVFWTISAASMGAPGIFVLFGIVFVLAGIAGAIYNFHNATAQNRFSNYDITHHHEESDPLSDAFGHSLRRPPTQRSSHATDTREPTGQPRRYEGDYCPFCGAAVQDNFDYCPSCGKDI